MTVAVQTVRPNGTEQIDAVNLNVLGGATAHEVLADDNDATMIFGHSFDGNGAGQTIVTFPAPAVAPGERIARVRFRLRAQDVDAQGTTIRADGGTASGYTAGYAESTPTDQNIVDYVGRWFTYRPQGGAWAIADAGQLRARLAFISGATALGANAIALWADVDVRPHLTVARRDPLADRR